MREIGIMEVGGFRLGHAQNEAAGTGLTVLLFDRMSPAGLDVRGGGPASRESQILSPLAAAEGLNALVLSGGSAFGLDAAGGVQKYLEARNIGFDVGVTKVPLVSESCVFDLGFGRMDVRPDAAMALEACENAGYDAPALGNVGAGTGCTVGKILGMDKAMKSGFGAYAVCAGALKVGAVVAVNALGDIYDGEQKIAGIRSGDGRTTRDILIDMAAAPRDPFTGNTTIGAIVTNADLKKPLLCKVAGMAHNGFARAIRPVHTMADGDSIYAVSTGSVTADINAVGTLAALVMEQAILRAVRSAKSMGGLPGLGD